MGFPSPAQDYIEGRPSLDELLRTREPSVFIVVMDSEAMQGAIHKGDLMVIDRALTARHGQIVIGIINGEHMCRRFNQVNSEVALTPDNPAYKPRYVLPGDELEVWGVVIGSVRRHEN